MQRPGFPDAGGGPVILTRAQKVRLGAFVVCGVGVLLLSLVTLTGLRLWEHRLTYRARFKESISGLESNSPVKYQGLRIGRVERMYIAPDDARAIEVELSLDDRTVLYEGVECNLDMGGLTGLKSINLSGGDPRRKKLPVGSMLPTGPSLFDRITDNAAAIVGDVKRVADEIAQWINHDNRQRLESLLINLDKFIGHLDIVMMDSKVPLRQLIHEFGKTAAAVGNTAEQATQTLQGVHQAVHRLEAQATTTMQAVARPLKDVDPRDVGQAVRAVRGAATTLNERLSAEETGRALASLGETLSSTNHLILDVDLAVRAGREDFTASLSYLRQAAEDLREFSRILAQNPSVLVRGRGESE
ncbi:MAG: MCE family protein [Deltaproteobacteria bacterium]|nr:MAG: MCE family protein [Deltaproteobacteria bacterium]